MMFGWTLIRIRGWSMAPVLPHGSYALFRAKRTVRTGDIVLADHPVLGPIVKSVRRQTPAGYILEGRSPASIGSAALGVIPRDGIVGVLVMAHTPPRRAPDRRTA